MKVTDLKLGEYRNGYLAVWVPCEPGEDPRPKLVSGPPPKPQTPKRKAKLTDGDGI